LAEIPWGKCLCPLIAWVISKKEVKTGILRCKPERKLIFKSINTRNA
jgi:hypothetical protein